MRPAFPRPEEQSIGNVISCRRRTQHGPYMASSTQRALTWARSTSWGVAGMLRLNNGRYLIPGVEFKNGTKWRREKMGKQSEK